MKGVGKFFLVIVVFAASIYAVLWLVETPRHPFRRTAPRKPLLPPRPGPSRPLAPDDDEDFLRDLNRRRREKKDDDSRPIGPGVDRAGRRPGRRARRRSACSRRRRRS